MTEYVRLSHPELVYGETNLLQSQMSLLTTLKEYKDYKENREEELVLKIALKKSISELKEFLDTLDKIMPKTVSEEEEKIVEEIKKLPFHEPIYKMPVPKVERPKVKEIKEGAKPKKLTKEIELSPLDQELQDIRDRLAKLH